MTQVMQTEPDMAGNFFEVYRAESDVTLVAFGGLGHEIGQPIFEFRKALQPLNVNLVLFKDALRGWYHHPIDGFGEGLVEKADRIASILDEIPSSRKIFVGSSAGGFAALMFSRLIPDVSDCLCFGPQTFIDKPTRQALGDMRWPKLIGGIKSKQYKNVSEISNNRQCKTRIIVGDNSEVDMRHALYAAGHISVDIHVLTKAGHNPARELKSAGVLSEVLTEFRDGQLLSDRKGLKIARRMARLTKL